jgi:uncharacterized peroxidase-related enzyme
MPRLNVVEPAQAEGKAKELFEGPLKGKHLNIFKGMANSGAALDAYVSLSGALANSTLSPAEREAIALTLAEANQCEYCTAAHTMIGKSVGLSEADTLALRGGSVSDPKLAALRSFVIALRERQGAVSDDELAAIRSAGYDDGHVAEMVACYAMNIYTNYFNHVNDTAVDLPAAPELG